jgi:hypothetical protein
MSLNFKSMGYRMHMLIFFAKNYKLDMVKDVNRMISVKLPNLETNRLAHETVAKCMMHGPCGAVFPNAPCMEEGKCKKNIHISFNPRR